MSGRRVFRRDRANLKQPLAKHKPKHSDLHLIRGRGLTRPYRLGDAAVQKQVLLKRFQGTLFQRSPLCRRQLEVRHSAPIAAADTEDESFYVRQVLLTRGPLSAERLYAAATALLPAEYEHWLPTPDSALVRLEALRHERYVFRLTMRRWRRLCALAGVCDGTELGLDARPLPDDEHVYVPREVFREVRMRARYQTRRFERTRSFYRSDFEPQPRPGAEALQALKVMAPLPTPAEHMQARAEYIADIRQRWLRMTPNPALQTSFPNSIERSVAGGFALQRRTEALNRLQRSAQAYRQEAAYVHEAEPGSVRVPAT